MSEDRIGFAGGDTNLYSYVQNNPIRYSDPSGNQADVFTSLIGPELGKAIFCSINPEKCPYIYGNEKDCYKTGTKPKPVSTCNPAFQSCPKDPIVECLQTGQ